MASGLVELKNKLDSVIAHGYEGPLQVECACVVHDESARTQDHSREKVPLLDAGTEPTNDVVNRTLAIFLARKSGIALLENVLLFYAIFHYSFSIQYSFK